MQLMILNTYYVIDNDIMIERIMPLSTEDHIKGNC